MIGALRSISAHRSYRPQPWKLLHSLLSQPVSAFQWNMSLESDNPCWGSFQTCTLEHLVQKQIKSESNPICFESEDYIVINKPPDLRMDGPYPATVLKMLVYYFPTERVKAIASQYKSSSTSFPISETPSVSDLCQSIMATIHFHKDAGAGAPHPCHQLDYATSGVLWVAKSTMAANRAKDAMERRLVKKLYSAILEGEVRIPNHASPIQQSWPIIPAAHVQEWFQSTEREYRRNQSKRRTDTFLGFLPPHSIFDVWKRKQQKHGSSDSTHKKRRMFDENNDTIPRSTTSEVPTANNETTKFNQEDWLYVLRPVQDAIHAAGNQGIDFSTLDWRTIKRNHTYMRDAFGEASALYAERLRSKLASLVATQVTDTFPTFFRVEEELATETSFYIQAPLAETKDDFAMRLPPTFQDHVTNTLLKIGNDNLIYKPCLTKCTILQKTPKYTKVLLEPRTGRRHQLRVHTALLGNPIVGDSTYNANNRATCFERMCLHSYRLSVAWDDGKDDIAVEAPDPFKLDENGRLTIDSF